MKLRGRSTFERYGIAILSVVIAAGLRSLLAPALGLNSPFILLYPAVAFAALFGGARAGITASALGVLLAGFFLMQPEPDLALHPTDLLQLGLFFAMGGFISWIVGERYKISTRLQTVTTESERRTSEAAEALRVSRERERLAESAASVGIWEWEPDSGRLEWSDGIFELLGLEPRSVEPSVELWYDAVVPDDLATAQATIKRFIDEGSPDFYDEFRITRRSDGRVVWLATQGKIFREDGKPIRLVGVNYDITEIKEKELEIGKLNKQLNRRIGELQAIFDLTPVGVAVARDAACDVITANPALAHMVGVSPGDNISSNGVALPYEHLKNGRVLEPHELPMQRAVAERRTIVNEELEIRRADGSAVTIYSYAAPVFDEGGAVVGCVSAQIDITDRKQQELKRERDLGTEQELRRAAEEANRLKDEFLATVSHELRTPLNSIIGWVSMLRDQTLKEDLRSRAVAAVERGARSQSQLIEDLLDVSRIISGKLQLSIKPVEIGTVVSAAIETLRPAAAAKDITVTLHADTEPGLVSGDRDRLQQIVWNLLSNAIKFTPQGGRVDIALRKGDSEFEMVITDTGKGITSDFLPLVFDRFRQADGSITRKFTGLGLGLSIVRHLVELHGGTVTAASDGENKGATFTVRLPARLQEPAREPSIAVNDPARTFPALNGLRILVVDDEQDTREILKIAFERCGLSVMSAASATEAFEKAQNWAPQLIVSDIGMPGEDGYSLMKRLRKWETETSLEPVPSIALTAYARAEDREEAIACGFQEHVAKPVEPSHLLSVIDLLIKR